MTKKADDKRSVECSTCDGNGMLSDPPDAVCPECRGGTRQIHPQDYHPVEMTWEDVARELWQLLDNISTIGDIAKGDNVAYRAMVEKEQVKRGLYMQSTDGYTLNPVVSIVHDGEKR
jgi:hypothetical protein